ncbi:MAG: CopG family transcriptional regulator [Defluviitaleaceae bacterium]|nr:CopG family transcriptional regulator [Defluviitaleaceae bacterium]
MSPRTGRPKVDNPKNHDIKVRIDEKTNQAIIRYAEKHNIARTEAIRRGIDLLLSQDKQ